MEDKEELFTMRLWKESLDQTHMEWRGKIQHVGSGQVAYFRDWSKVMDFISAALPNLPQRNRIEEEKLSGVDRLRTSRGDVKRGLRTIGFMFVGAISMILGWDQIGANDPRTTSVISGLTALLLGAIIISQKLKKLWEQADHHLMSPTS